MKTDLIDQVKNCLQKILSTPHDNVFDELLNSFHLHYGKSCHNMQELRDKANKKIKGDLFEHFALLYLEHKMGLDAWLLEDVPQEHLDEVKLGRRDMGIDLIALDKQGRYYAVQVKFRSRSSYKSRVVVGWKQLSTFFALAARSGPYHKVIVFTNADSVHRVGGVRPGDKSICIGTLRKIKQKTWLSMAGVPGQKVCSEKHRKLSRSKVREARIKALS